MPLNSYFNGTETMKGLVTDVYHIAQNGGRGKLWQIGNFKNLAGKTLVNCNELSLFSLIKTRHLHAMINLKIITIYFIITCGKWYTRL